MKEKAPARGVDAARLELFHRWREKSFANVRTSDGVGVRSMLNAVGARREGEKYID